ncbi:MAG: arsenate reductase (azurin) small subunit [Pseudomonadota bacterium]
MTSTNHPHGRMACVSRRQMLILGGSAVTVVALPAGDVLAQVKKKGEPKPKPTLVKSAYEPKKIVPLAQIKPRKPIEFTYPNDDVTNILVKLGERAGAGVGADDDIVAFNTVCPHMGGPLGAEVYKPEHSVLGPCPLHLSTYDLTKHGMLLSGHSSDGLPQIVLEVRGADVYAVGVMGLIYGYDRNPITA